MQYQLTEKFIIDRFDELKEDLDKYNMIYVD